MLTRYTTEAAGLKECDGTGKFFLFVTPNDSEKALLQSEFHLDDYDVASSLDPDETARLESAQNRALLIWKTPQSAVVNEAVELRVHSIGIVLTEDRIAFVTDDPHVSFSGREYRNLAGARDVLLAYLLQSIRHYVGHLRVIRQLSGELEKKITVSMENRHLLQMFALSESLIYYVDGIEGNGIVLKKLRGLATQLGFTECQVQLLDDIVLENEQAARQSQIYSTVLSGLMDARGTIVNNNMNVLLKNLTLINIVFLPLNLIASIWGMSEWSAITQGMDWRLSYGLFTLGMLAFGWLTWVFVIRLIERSGARAERRLSPLPPTAKGRASDGRHDP
jgi:magnesium transporter